MLTLLLPCFAFAETDMDKLDFSPTRGEKFIDFTATNSKTFIEVGIGTNNSLINPGQDWNDGGGTGAYIGIRREWSNGWVIQLSHYSQWEIGPPFNNKEESSLDHIGLGYRFQIFK